MGKSWREGNKGDKTRKFNRDEKRKQKHERNAIRAVDVERLVEVEEEAGNTFFSVEKTAMETLEDARKAYKEMDCDFSEDRDFEEWLDKKNGHDIEGWE